MRQWFRAGVLLSVLVILCTTVSVEEQSAPDSYIRDERALLVLGKALVRSTTGSYRSGR
jgi:hypothetical protein